MVITLEDANEEREDREESETGLAEGLEGLDVPEETLEEFAERALSFLIPTPDDIDVGDEASERQRQRQIQIRKEFLTRTTEENVNLDLGSLDETLAELGELELDALNNQALLQAIANATITTAQLSRLATDTLIQHLSTTVDILAAVEPFRRVTVSGTNDLDTADDPVPVVPNSDTQSTATRILFIKASDDNKEEIAIGDDETEPDNGWILDAGDHLTLGIDLREDILWMSGENASDTVELLGLV